MVKRYSRVNICWDSIVAVCNEDVGDWAAYLGSSTLLEEDIARHGDKITQAVAELLFPTIAKKFKWRN